MSHRNAGNKKRTEFQNLTDAEVSKRARDRSRPKAEQRAYQQEEKARQRRNQQRRRSD